MQRKTSSTSLEPDDNVSRLSRLLQTKARTVGVDRIRREITVRSLFTDYRKRFPGPFPEEPALSFELLQPELIKGVFADDLRITFNPFRQILIFERVLEPDALERASEILAAALRPRLANELHDLTGFQFEKAVAEILRSLPWVRQVTETKLTADGGVDVEARMICGENPRVVLALGQVKRTKAKTGSPAMRNFVGSLVSHRPKPKLGLFISLSGFSDQAFQAAVDSPIRIRTVDGEELIEWLFENEAGITRKQVTLHSVDASFWKEIHETSP